MRSRPHVVALYSYHMDSFEVTDFDRWKYTRKNWFTDQLWKILSKLGCLSNPIDTKMEFTRALIDTESVSKAVMLAMDTIYHSRGRPKHIYMGPEEFESHLMEPIAKEFMKNNVNFNLPFRDGGYRMFDVPVSVIPYMEGLLVV